MRPLGIVLAITAATLWVTFPTYDYAYSQISSSLPGTMLLLQIVLIPLAIAVAMMEVSDADKADKQTSALLERIATSLERAHLAPPSELHAESPSEGESTPKAAES